MMSATYIVFAALFMGFFGSVHCAAMCGGVAGTLHRRQSIPGRVPAVLVMAIFNSGRLLSYALAGAIAALFGRALVSAIGHEAAGTLMQLFTGAFLIMVGLSIAGWWSGLGRVEKLGGRFWQVLSPLTRHLLPINSIPRAFAAGVLWGWLPCGLVYSALVLVMGSGQPVVGAVALLAFGIGTTPMMASIGIASQNLKLKSHPLTRRVAGAAVVAFGAMLVSGLSLTGLSHH